MTTFLLTGPDYNPAMLDRYGIDDSVIPLDIFSLAHHQEAFDFNTAEYLALNREINLRLEQVAEALTQTAFARTDSSLFKLLLRPLLQVISIPYIMRRSLEFAMERHGGERILMDESLGTNALLLNECRQLGLETIFAETGSGKRLRAMDRPAPVLKRLRWRFREAYYRIANTLAPVRRFYSGSPWYLSNSARKKHHMLRIAVRRDAQYHPDERDTQAEAETLDICSGLFPESTNQLADEIRKLTDEHAYLLAGSTNVTVRENDYVYINNTTKTFNRALAVRFGSNPNFFASTHGGAFGFTAPIDYLTGEVLLASNLITDSRKGLEYIRPECPVSCAPNCHPLPGRSTDTFREMPRSGSGTVCFVPTSFPGMRSFGPNNSVLDPFYLKAQLEMIEAMQRAGLEVVYKVHPKQWDLDTLIKLWGERLTIERCGLDEACRKYDTFVFDYPASAFNSVALANKNIIFIELGARKFTAKGLEACMDRAHFIRFEDIHTTDWSRHARDFTKAENSERFYRDFYDDANSSGLPGIKS